MSQLLSPSVLQRIQTNSLKADKAEQPLMVAEIFRAVSDGVWSDLPNGAPVKEGKKAGLTIIRRNLQREHVKELSGLVLGEKPASGGFNAVFFTGASSALPPDARSLARLHLREISKRIQAVLGKQGGVDETTLAHLEECRERIEKVLTASMQVND
jgi:hypothetical protein